MVKQGTLTQTGPDCTKTQSYGVGSTFVEPSGADHVHVGRNLGSTPLVLDVLYVNPAKSPLAEDVPNPGCVFQCSRAISSPLAGPLTPHHGGPRSSFPAPGSS